MKKIRFEIYHSIDSAEAEANHLLEEGWEFHSLNTCLGIGFMEFIVTYQKELRNDSKVDSLRPPHDPNSGVHRLPLSKKPV